MTPTRSPRRGALLAVGGMFVVASTLLGGAPMAGAVPTTDAVNAINDRYATFGGEASLLGAPIGEIVDVKGGAERDFAGGVIFYSKDSGAHVMYGEILEKYKALGGPDSELGFPKNDESDSGDGIGRFNDFTELNGEQASIYWTPNVGAWVIKGKVLDAWRAAGGIKSPFGYPTADTTTNDGTLTSTFVGPDGTQIQWSKAAGLVTIPAALGAKIPGFGPPPEATTSATKTSATASDAPAVEKKSSKWWWWIPIILALLGLLALLPRLFRKSKTEPEPVKVVARAPEVRNVATRAPEVKQVVTPPPPPPVKKVVAPPPPPRPAAKPPMPAAPLAPPAPPIPPVVPPVKKVVAPPPPPPRPVVPEAPKLAERLEHKAEHLADRLSDKTEKISDKLSDKADTLADKLSEKADTLADKAERAVETPKAKIHEAADKADRAFGASKAGLLGAADKAADKVEHIVEAPVAKLHEAADKTEQIVDSAKAKVHEVAAEHDISPVIRYESHDPADTTIQVTYENNAVGDHQESRADKSDLTPDHLQE